MKPDLLLLLRQRVGSENTATSRTAQEKIYLKKATILTQYLKGVLFIFY